ncbi:hypothetical protein L7F22_066832 [Adiantum nelumboides]|nr:hypothetical protein [Adiantum nelumboides]
MGPYRSAYTRNGRHLVLGGRKGHLAAFDWQTGKLMCEVNVNETVRDVTWLHNHSFFAAAQKKYTYIYDRQGAEVHRLKDHIDVNRLEFLPYHFLLASVGQAGYLKYQDTSTGTLIAEHRTGLGSCSTMAQNPLTAVIHLGHANGTVTLWTPNLSTPALKMLAHRGPVSGISVSAHSGAREMATSGLDGSVKVWDSRMLGRGAVREWQSPRPASDLRYSQRGLLAMAWGTHVSVYDTKRPIASGSAPGPYLNNGFPQGAPIQIGFCPFEDVLGVAHARGFDSLVVPGSGEARFDSSEADPYESRKSQREREVRSLLDKVQPDTISLDPEMLGQLDVPQADAPREESDDEEERLRIKRRGGKDQTPFARMKRIERLRLQGKADEGGEPDQDLGQSSDEDEDDAAQGDKVKSKSGWNQATGPSIEAGRIKEKKKARGRNTTMKRFLKKKRENVVDPQTVAVREKLERLRQEQRDAQSSEGLQAKEPSALDVFTNKRKRTRSAR